MKKGIVERPSLGKYFAFEFRYFSFTNNFHYNSQIFNPFAGFTVLIIFFFLAGFWERLFWAGGMSLIAVLVFVYFKTLKFANGLLIERTVPALGREGETVEATYRFTNATTFTIPVVSFEEYFDGIKEGKFKVETLGLRPGVRRQVKKKLTLNNGMGIKSFKPIEFIIKDELGIFDFKVRFPTTHEMEVLPYIEAVPNLVSTITPFSIQFGFYEIAKRGDSTLFIGTRPYVHGDPVKRINWKLSLKSDGLVVNEFEKTTNTFVTFLLNLDYENQLGTGAISTWESSKDLALSLIVNEINKLNSVQVISDNLYIPFGTGPDQLSLIEKHFTHHELHTGKDESHLRYLAETPSDGQIYYLCPLLPTLKVQSTLEHLKNLSLLGHAVVIFLMNPFKELIKEVKEDYKVSLFEIERHAKSEFGKLEVLLRHAGIPVIEIESSRMHTLRSQLEKKGDPSSGDKMTSPFQLRMFVVFCVTLTYGTCLALHSFRYAPFYFIVFSLSFLALHFLNYGEQFFRTFDQSEVRQPTKILVAGLEVESEKLKDEHENRFLSLFNPSLRVKRKLLSWLVFGGCLWFVQKKTGLSWQTLTPVGLGFLIVNSFYTGHLLIPLFLNAILVLGGTSGKGPTTSMLPYAFLFFTSVAMLKKNSWFTVAAVVQITFIFSAVAALSHGFLKTSEDNSREVSEFRRNKQIRDIAKSMANYEQYLKLVENVLKETELSKRSPSTKLEKSLAEAKAELEFLKGITNSESTWSPEVASDGLKKLQALSERVAKEHSQMEAEAAREKNQEELDFINKLDGKLSPTSKNDKTLREELYDLSNQLGDTATSEQKKFLTELQTKVEELSPDRPGLEREIRSQLESFKQNMTNDKGGKENSMSLSSEEKTSASEFIKRLKAEATDLSPERKLDLNLAALKLESKLNSVSGPADREALSTELRALQELAKKARDEKQNRRKAPPVVPIQPSPEKKNAGLDEKFKRIGIIVVSAFGILYVLSKFRRKKITRFETDNANVVSELKNEWRKLNSQRLTPREEIITHYHLFHESMKKIHYRETETPPSCILYAQMREQTPESESSSFYLTDIYARTFYGEKTVTPEMLKDFRKSLKAILKIYQLT